MNTSATLPLSGITVLDLTRVLSGPLATMILGDLGADVIKIERINGGDDTRQIPPIRFGESHYFLSANRNKRSVALDLKSPDGLELVKRLARHADIVVENFRPGVSTELGVDYQSLKEENPTLIYCSISGFGQTGELAQRPAFDIVVQALSGAMSVNGNDEDDAIKLGVPLGDLSAGLFAVIGILGALAARERTQQGTWVDVSMLDTTIGLLGHLAGQYLMTGTSPVPVGSSHHNIVPYGTFHAADGDIVIATITAAFWPRLCRAIDLDELETDPRFATNEARCAHRAELDSLIQGRIATRSVDDWCERFLAADIPHAPILSVGEALEQAHVQERGMVRTVSHPVLGNTRIIGPVLHFGGEQLPVSPPPVHGQDTAAVLKRLAGLSDAEIERLVQDGVISLAAAATTGH